jgi:hypothetical protein
MFGCIGKIVVLAILIVCGAVAYLTRGMWEPKLREKLGMKPAPVAAAPKWEPVTSEGATRARTAIDGFKRTTGPVFVNVGAGDLVAYAAGPIPKVLTGAEALAGENEISVRGRVKMAELGGSTVLGPMAGALGGTQAIEVRGRLEVTAPGKGLLRITRIKIGDLVLPGALTGRVVQRIAAKQDNTLADEAFVLTIPAEVADVRVTGGRVTLYKAVK